MSVIHILLQKEYHLDNRLLSKYTFWQIAEPPTTLPQFAKVVSIQPGEYIDAFECIPSADFSHVDITIYRLSNVDGQLQQDLLESFFMEKNK